MKKNLSAGTSIINLKAFIFLLTVNCLLPTFSFSQPSFIRCDTIKVKSGTAWLVNPWAGGINFAQLSAIDLNMDGNKDLFVFDRDGNKPLTFINGGISDSVNYIYAPVYETKFPPLHDWALLADYNCDGKEDVFSYSNGGFCVWKNISDSFSGLQFVLDSANMFFLGYWKVASDYGSGTYNLFVTAVDIPAITDIDGDGDLDVLTFEQFGGTTVEYHRNQSMELYGNCDSLNFVRVTTCWGNFYENALDNTVVYPATCKGPASTPPLYDYSDNSVHSGSTLLAFDNDCDNDKELVLGDIAFSNMVLVINGGDSSEASIIADDNNFPAGTAPIDVRLFPAGFFLDVDNDSINDLVISPNAKNVSENFTSVCFYKNQGTGCAPQFVFSKNNLLQDEMLDFGSGAYPVFFDFDADGKKDILVGNYGYYSQTGNYPSGIAALKNTGTSFIPQFELITRDYAAIESLGLSGVCPALGDIDNDGDDDMLLGVREGYLVYLENAAGAGNPSNFQFSQSNYAGIDVGWFAAPQIIDLDRDGLPDLVIGEQNGNLNFYKNSGTPTNPSFTFITDSLGEVNTATPFAYFGFTVPFFYDDNGSYNLICGTENGALYFYQDIDANIMGTFTLVNTFLGSIAAGFRSSSNGADINNDGLIDLVAGNYRGGISIYFGDTLLPTGENRPVTRQRVVMYPNPVQNILFVHFPPESRSEKWEIIISAVSGKRLMELNTISHFSGMNRDLIPLPVNTLPPGMYFCTLRSESCLFHHRFAVIR